MCESIIKQKIYIKNIISKNKNKNNSWNWSVLPETKNPISNIPMWWYGWTVGCTNKKPKAMQQQILQMFHYFAEIVRSTDNSIQTNCSILKWKNLTKKNKKLIAF